MEQITEEECINLLKEKFPEFIPYWEAESVNWDEQGITALFGPFADYTMEVIKTNNPIQLRKIFDYVEFLLYEGDQTVQDGVATIFLEALMNKDPAEFKFKTIFQYLGKNSIEYCRAWDKFCGVRTEGLWDEQMAKTSLDVPHN